MLIAGKPFPNFELLDQNGDTRSLAEFLGKPFIVYFYPKDDTSGCTLESCEFSERMPKFGDIPVIGVSPDSVKSHAKFAKKYDLKITLLADTEKSLIEPSGLWIEKMLYGKKYMGVDRTTVLVDANGVIKQVWNKVKPDGHAEEVLAAALA